MLCLPQMLFNYTRKNIAIFVARKKKNVITPNNINMDNCNYFCFIILFETFPLYYIGLCSLLLVILIMITSSVSSLTVVSDILLLTELRRMIVLSFQKHSPLILVYLPSFAKKQNRNSHILRY